MVEVNYCSCSTEGDNISVQKKAGIKSMYYAILIYPNALCSHSLQPTDLDGHLSLDMIILLLGMSQWRRK